MTQQKQSADPIVTPTPAVKNLTSEPMHQWAHSALNQKTQSEAMSLNLYYGLRSEADVDKFLNSPGGKQVLAEIDKEFMIQAMIREQRSIDARESQAAIQRIEAAMLLWATEEEAQATIQKDYILLQQIEKRIRESAPSPDRAAKSAVQESLNNTVADYEKALGVNEKLIEANAQEAKRLASDKNNLTANIQKIDNRYNNLTGSLNNTEENFNTLDRSGIQKEMNTLNNRAQLLEKEIDYLIIEDRDEEAIQKKEELIAIYVELENYKDMLTATEGKPQEKTRFNHFVDKDGNKVDSRDKAEYLVDNDKKLIKNKQGELCLIDADQNFGKLSEAEKEKARADFIEQKPDLMATQYKQYVDKDGNPSDSRDKAEYLVNSESRLVKNKDGELCLISKNTDWASLSSEDKEQARANFIRQEPNLKVLQKIVTKNQELEQKDNKEKIDHVDTALKGNLDEKLRLENQRSTLSSGLAQTRQMQQQADAGQDVSFRPTPAPTVSTSTFSSSKSNATAASNASTASYLNQQRNELRQKVYQNRAVTLDDLEQIQRNLVLRGDTSNAAALASFIQNMPRIAGAIPPAMMRGLLQNMDRLGIDSTNPAVTAYQSPLEMQQNVKEQAPTQVPALEATEDSPEAEPEDKPAPK